VFATAVSTLTGVLDRRFLRSSFALSLAFMVLSGVVVLAGMGRLGAVITTWQSWPALTQLLAAAGFIAAVWVLAVVVQSQTRSITQGFEGYWSGPLRGLRSYGESRHWQRLDELRSAGKVAEIYARYPLSRNQVMATRLGNILRAAERYPALIAEPRICGVVDAALRAAYHFTSLRERSPLIIGVRQGLAARPSEGGPTLMT